MVFLFIIIFWALIPVYYSNKLAEDLEMFFTWWKRGKFLTLWGFVDVFIIRFSYVYFNFVLFAKTLYELDVKNALIIGGVIFGFAIFCLLLSIIIDTIIAFLRKRL